MARNRLRQLLRSGQTTYGVWITLESPSVTELAVLLGLDWICVDSEHGHLGWAEILEHVRTVRDSNTTVLVRVPTIREDTVKRALDVGAHGVLLPLVRTREDVEAGMRFGRYPPAGRRGIGGERAVQWGLGLREYLEKANEETMIIPLIETREAAEDIDGILSVPGVEAIFFGPADLSASMGFTGAWEGPGVADLILRIRELAAGRGVAAGIIGTDATDAARRRDQGFGLVGLGSDVGLMIRALQDSLTGLGRETKPHLWF